MGRHSTGKNNYALSKGVIALLCLIAAIALGIAAIVALRSGGGNGDNDRTDSAQECVSGDLSLPVAASDEKVGRTLVESYADSNPVVRDYCVTPEYVESLADAAVYVAPNTIIAHREIETAGRSAATNEPPAVITVPVGVAGSASTNAAAVELTQIDFPTGDQPEASALVASAIAGNDSDAVAALTDQRIPSTGTGDLISTRYIATAEDSVPDGFTFSPLEDTSIVYSAIFLNSGGDVTEDQARAGQAFAEFSGDAFGEKGAQLPVVGESVWAAAQPDGGRRLGADAAGSSDNAAQSTAGALDTLFVLDTSAAMQPFSEAAAAAVGEAADDVVGAGHRVALWNYSSPLSPGAVQSYRTNIDFTDDAGAVADSASLFANDGQPNTRETVLAALQYAESVASDGQPVRIVLITSGTADGEGAESDTAVAQAIKDARANGVELSVVATGDGETDKALEGAADAKNRAPKPEDLGRAVREAAGV